jgi:hypothetical protein
MSFFDGLRRRYPRETIRGTVHAQGSTRCVRLDPRIERIVSVGWRF